MAPVAVSVVAPGGTADATPRSGSSGRSEAGQLRSNDLGERVPGLGRRPRRSAGRKLAYVDAYVRGRRADVLRRSRRRESTLRLARHVLDERTAPDGVRRRAEAWLADARDHRLPDRLRRAVRGSLGLTPAVRSRRGRVHARRTHGERARGGAASSTRPRATAPSSPPSATTTSSIPYGGCRMCVVDVEGAPRPMPACATRVTEGMVVSTNGPITDFQRTLTEMLLSEHLNASPGRPAERAPRPRERARRRGAADPPRREARGVRRPQPAHGLRPGRVHPLQPLRPLHAGGHAVLGALASRGAAGTRASSRPGASPGSTPSASSAAAASPSARRARSTRSSRRARSGPSARSSRCGRPARSAASAARSTSTSIPRRSTSSRSPRRTSTSRTRATSASRAASPSTSSTTRTG